MKLTIGVIDDGDGDAIELGQDLAGIAVDPAHRRIAAPVTALVAKTPVSNAPRVPPIPWTPKASRESS